MVSGRNAAGLDETLRPDGWAELKLARVWERAVSGREQTYQIRMWIPEAAPPPDGFPVIYVLDGNQLFLLFAETVRRLCRFPERTGVAPAVVVGVGHEGADNSRRRYLDFTFGPLSDPADAPSGVEWGGGQAFLDLLVHRIRPLIADTAPVNEMPAAIYGHSLSAYFALHAAAARPDVFTTCGAISPSLWWESESDFAVADGLHKSRIFLAAGERELAISDERRSRRTMALRFRQLEASLRQSMAEASFKSRIFAEEDHGSVASVAIASFLRFASIKSVG